MALRIRQAASGDTASVSAILTEAADWLVASGMAMWRGDELSEARLSRDVADGLFFLADIDGEPAGTIKFQPTDDEFWPDVPSADSAYVHRLAVRRRFAGGGVSTALLAWATDHARSLGRRWLRLDTEASRPALRSLYERFGFRHHSDRQVGPYFVARYELDVTARPGSSPR